MTADRRPRAVLLSQGDEVITGQTVDTNASWLAERLTDLGLDVVRKITVGDRLDDIVEAIETATRLGDAVIGTGGLGPTQDDLTAEAAARVLGVPLVQDDEALARVQRLYDSMGREMAESNVKQTRLPRSAGVLQNDWGTAPGFRIEHQGALASVLPGVPREMRAFWEHRVRDELTARLSLTPGRLVTLRCMGIHESKLATLLAPFAAQPGVALGFRTRLPENQVKLRIEPQVSDERVAELVGQIREVIGKPVFGVDTGPVEQVVGELLAERQETLATAESCTGGSISAAITSIPGASRYFLEGACCYSNEAKVRTCGVPAALIAENGAVSEPVARAMASGMRAAAGTTYALATTGIAGPGGGSADKPVGTVHLALAAPDGVHHLRLRLLGDRERIVRLTTGAALDMLRRRLTGLLSPPS